MNKIIKTGFAALSLSCATMAYAQDAQSSGKRSTTVDSTPVVAFDSKESKAAAVSSVPPLPPYTRHPLEQPVMVRVTYTQGSNRMLGDTVKPPASQTVSMMVTSLPAKLEKIVSTPYISSCAVITTRAGGQIEKEKVHSEVETGLRMSLSLLDTSSPSAKSEQETAKVQFRISLSGLTVTPPGSDDQCSDLLTVDSLMASGVVAVPFDGSVEHLMGDAGKLTFTAQR